MLDSDKKRFAETLALTFSVYSKPAPDQHVMRVWFGQLAAFDLLAVQRAFDRFVATEPKFPPTPGSIRQILGANREERPGADEAWSTALGAQDESETVVWTEEAAEAFNSCRAVLDGGDRVGARMAFKGAYERLVEASRSAGKPVKWVHSLGHDVARRSAVLQKAVSDGLLPAPVVAGLLLPPSPEASATSDEKAIENLARIKRMMAEAFRSSEQMQRDHDEMVECERAEVERRKDQLSAQAEDYAKRTGAK